MENASTYTALTNNLFLLNEKAHGIDMTILDKIFTLNIYTEPH